MERALLDVKTWAEMEFGEVDVGDIRRTRNLVEIGRRMASKPGGTLASAIREWGELKRAYGVLARDEVTHERVIRPHVKRTRAALRETQEALVLEDTTSLNYETRWGIEGMGWMGDGRRGLTVHSSLALAVEKWDKERAPVVSVLGLAAQKVWTRLEEPKSRKESRRQRLERPRESQRWAASIKEIGPPPKGKRWTYIADRESDIYEVFTDCVAQGWDLIIRAKEPRALLNKEGSLLEAVKHGRLLGTATVKLRPQSAAPGRKARKGRIATLSLRTAVVTLRPPWRPNEKLKPLTLNVVEVREMAPPRGEEPLHWVLITTWPCDNFELAWCVVQAYEARWFIEEYHKALKSGTGVEKAQLSTLRRIEVLVGILSIVAVRLLSLKLIAGSQPDQKVDEDEIGREILHLLESRFGKPQEGWTYKTVTIAIARLGGFLARRSDGMPGWITIWRGWQELMTMLHGIELFNRSRFR